MTASLLAVAGLLAALVRPSSLPWNLSGPPTLLNNEGVESRDEGQRRQVQEAHAYARELTKVMSDHLRKCSKDALAGGVQ